MSNIFEFTNKLRLVEIHRGYGLENITGHLWLATKDFALVSQLQDFDIDGVAILPMHQQLDFDF